MIVVGILIYIILRVIVFPSKPKNTEPQGYRHEISGFIPIIWLDEYRLTELIPKGNTEYITSYRKNNKLWPNIDETEALILSEDTIDMEIRADYLNNLFIQNGFFVEAKPLYGNTLQEIDNITAYGFPEFYFFVETEDEFVRYISVSRRGKIAERWQQEKVLKLLYILGMECDLILVSWESLTMYDISSKKETTAFMAFAKN